MPRLDGALDLARTVSGAMYDLDLKYPATALAYYAFVSFIPLLILVVVLLGRQLAVQVYVDSARFVTPDTQELFYEALTTASGRTGAVVLSVVAIGWGGGNIAVGLLTAFERVEGRVYQPLADQVRHGTVVLGALSLAILAVFVQSLFLAVTATGPASALFGFVALPIVLTAAFLPLYYVPSRLVTSPAAALPGALTTAFGWTLLHAGIQFYAANASRYAIYGVVSGIVIILTTTYLAAFVLMMGVVVNATLVGESVGPPGAEAA